MESIVDRMDEFRKHLLELHMADNTAKAYMGAVAAYANWYHDSFGEAAPMRLYRPNIQDYISFLRVLTKSSPPTINAKIAALKCYNEFLIETGRQEDIVIQKRDHIKVQVQYASPNRTSKEEVDALRQRILKSEGIRDYAMVTLMAYAGLRVSEVCNSKMTDLNLIAAQLKVEHGKGDKSRTVDLNDTVVHALRTYLKERPDTESSFIFISRQGENPSRQRMNQVIRKYSDHLTPHDLRHFFCSRALECDMNIAEVASQAGHSNVRTTLRYTHPTVKVMKEKMNRM